LTESESALPGLSADVTASLDQAFAEEVTERLPRLLAAAARLRHDRSTRAAHEVSFDLHTLASSAVLVGRLQLARAARRCEQMLLPYCSPRRQRVPARVAGTALSCIETIRRELEDAQ
jgi:chemotaxis protein histidine kinase CheA